jgi:hypothetical protein
MSMENIFGSALLGVAIGSVHYFLAPFHLEAKNMTD